MFRSLPTNLIRLGLLAFLFFPPALAQRHNSSLAFIHANVVDGLGETPIPDALVLVSGGKIQKVQAHNGSVPEGAEIIDVQGYYLLPGLIDAHAHLGTLEDGRRALEAGVTTVRSASVGSFRDVALRDMVRQGILAGPDILASGIFVQPELGESILADSRLMTLHEGVRTPAELRQLVRIILDHDVDWVKSRANERAGILEQDPRRLVYSEQQLRIIVEEASKRGIPVMCHAHSDEGIRAAVRAGVRSIEHGSLISEETLILMKEKGVFLVPTYSEMFDLTQPGGEYDHPLLQLRGLHLVPRVARNIQRAHRLGVSIVAGGDTGYEAGEALRVGTEVAQFVSLGFSPLQALQTATKLSAELLGLEGKTGTIQAGLEADLIIVGENPLENIWALHDVLLVMSNGHIVLNRLSLERRPSQ